MKRSVLLSQLVFVSIMSVLVFSAPAWAHHILGVPHYAYDEAYPQTPVLTYRADVGSYELKMTGNPGKPRPGQRCSLHVYIRDPKSGAVFDDTVTLSVFRDQLVGADPIIYGPIKGRIEEAMYKFFPTFDEEANYRVRIEFEADGEPWIIDLPMVAGEPGSPWAVLGSIAAGVGVFLIVVRALRIKMKRRERVANAALQRAEGVPF